MTDVESNASENTGSTVIVISTLFISLLNSLTPFKGNFGLEAFLALEFQVQSSKSVKKSFASLLQNLLHERLSRILC
jgi:hypothetical protein